jgi:hypothetical protein
MSDFGFVYALKNSILGEDIYKIGMTEKDPKERAKELSSQTSIPSPFEIVAAIKVYKPSEAESFIHDRLAEHRVNGKKEFFKVELNRLKIAMRETAFNFRLPIIKDIEKGYDKANDELRQFVVSFERILKTLHDSDSFFEYESEEFRKALDKYETLSMMVTIQVADRIRTQAEIEKKSVNLFIRDIIISYIDKGKT